MALALESSSAVIDDLFARADELHISIARQQAQLLELLAELDEVEAWRDSGYRDTASLVAARYGITHFAAVRRVEAGKALRSLPRTREALAGGQLSVEKAVELTRMATPQDEAKLISWAKGVSPSAIRARADAASRPDIQEVKSVHDQRNLRWWHEDGGYRFCIAGEMTSDAGAVVAKALDGLADSLPTDPEGDATWDLVGARRADALVALASGNLDGSESDRACVVVHAELSDLLTGRHHPTLEGGSLIHPDTASRMVCDGKMRIVLHEDGKTVGIGYTSRVVPNWLGQQVRRIYGCCCFPGCHSKRYLISHHAEPWPFGPTDLTNLAAVCTFHHRLVHEGGWKVRVMGEGEVEWVRPDGSVFVLGPSPPT